MRTTLVVALALAACKGDPAPAAAPPPSPSVASGEAPAATPPAADPTRDLDNAMGRILAALESERLQRPNPGPSAEELLARLATVDLVPAPTKQYVAATVHARYCVGGTTAGQITIAVCEYASAADAAAGRAHVMKAFAGLNDRRVIVVTGASTITVGGIPVADLEQRYGQFLATL